MLDFEGDSIKSDYLGALYTDISYESRKYLDSIYNEDKTQKLKYCIYAYNKEGEFNAIRLELYQLELNDSIIGFPYCYNAKIKFDNEKIKVE